MIFPQNKSEALVCGLLVVLVVVAFLPVGQNKFVNFDDGVYLHQNPHVQNGLSADSIKWAFTTGYASNWHPLTWIVHTLNWQVFDKEPRGHHWVNVLVHAASSVVLFLLLVRMTSPPRKTDSLKSRRRPNAAIAAESIWPAALVAAVFAVHPLRVESVAWASELKDVLCTFFWWLSIAAYVSYVRRPSAARYALLIAFFALGLLSKPMIVTLPLVLLLLDYWPLMRVPAADASAPALARQMARLIVEKIPLFALTLASCVATYLAQSRGGTTELLEPVPLHLRLANAALSTVAYLRQTFWPTRLACFYPYPRAALRETGLWRLDVVASIALVMALSAAAIWLGRRRRWLLVGWFWYLVTLVPVIGMIQVGRQARADRYTYVPLVGIYLVVAWGLNEWIERRAAGRKRVATVVASAAVLVLVALTWRQVRTWHDDFTLFDHAARVVPANDTALRNLGSSYFLAGDNEKAIQYFLESIRYRPEYAPTYRNMAVVLDKLGRSRAAEHYFQEALQRDPKWTMPMCNLATIYMKSQDSDLHRPAEALRLAERAVSLSGGSDALCLEVLMQAYVANGDTPSAIQTAERGLELARRTNQPHYVRGFRRVIGLLQSRTRQKPPAQASAEAGPPPG